MCYDKRRFGTENAMERKGNANHFVKIWEVLKPCVIYYVVCNVVFLLMILLYHAAAESFAAGFKEYAGRYATELTQLVNSVAMAVAVLPLIPMLRQELTAGRAYSKDRSGNRTESGNIRWILAVPLTVILAASSSVGFNILITLTGLLQTSAVYQDVAKQQFGIVFGLGAVLFGLIAPLAEEVVFRGLVFNRMRRYYSPTAAIIASGVLFGIYHGNIVQGVYGCCMGVLLAYTYERMCSFLIPCLFHAVSNIVVYTLAQNAELQSRLFTVPGCIILLMISAFCVFLIEKFMVNRRER